MLHYYVSSVVAVVAAVATVAASAASAAALASAASATALRCLQPVPGGRPLFRFSVSATGCCSYTNGVNIAGAGAVMFN